VKLLRRALEALVELCYPGPPRAWRWWELLVVPALLAVVWLLWIMRAG